MAITTTLNYFLLYKSSVLPEVSEKKMAVKYSHAYIFNDNISRQSELISRSSQTSYFIYFSVPAYSSFCSCYLCHCCILRFVWMLRLQNNIKQFPDNWPFPDHNIQRLNSLDSRSPFLCSPCITYQCNKVQPVSHYCTSTNVLFALVLPLIFLPPSCPPPFFFSSALCTPHRIYSSLIRNLADPFRLCHWLLVGRTGRIV